MGLVRSGVTTPQHPLVELATGALAELERVPRFGEASRGRTAEIERAWVRAPLSVGIGGAVRARTELFNHLCGRTVLDAATRPVESAALRIRRGTHTRFEARRDDGSTEAHVLPAEQADDEPLRLRARAARAEVEERTLALQRVEHVLPRLARSRPRGLLVLLWPVWWLLTRRHRRALAERRFSEIACEQSRDALELAERELAASEQRIRIERGRFFESLRALASGPPLGGTVREVRLELGDGPLPPGVELVELARPQVAEHLDAIFLVERDALHAPHLADGAAPRVGSIAEAIPDLLVLLGRARALVLARRARDELEPALTALDDDITDTEEAFRVRIERLEAMQILEDDELVRTEMAKLAVQIAPSIHAVIEHGAAHLGGELQRLGAEWAAVIASAGDGDALKQAVLRIESSAPADARRIAEEVRLLVVGGAAGSAHDVLPELLAVLRPHGLEEPRPRSAPPLPPIAILPSLVSVAPAKLSGAASWLGGLFKSFESRRADVLAKADARITHLREVAQAELLDAEPVLRAAIDQALREQFFAAIGRQRAWLERALGAERDAVAREGLALAPLARMRDRLRLDLEQLTAGIAQLEREYPGLAAAASAVTSIA